MSKFRVGVLGAGVVGLNTALMLQNEFPNADITIIADKFTKDTTSDGVAGSFKPGTEFSGPTEEITVQWIRDSFNYYNELMNADMDCGVSIMGGFHYSNLHPSAVRNEVLEKVLRVYRTATPEELQKGKWKYGSFFETLLIECPTFLPWATKKFEGKGGRVKKQTIKSFKELQGQFDILVNCCGLGARELCNDKKVFPIRGQIIKMAATWFREFYYSESDTYIIPQTNGSVTLGSVRHFGSFDKRINPHDTADILQRVNEIDPRISGSRILKEWVGLRPYRHVVRVEKEQIGTLKVVHNYGHGGYGVTSAPGTSKLAVQLVREMWSSNSKK